MGNLTLFAYLNINNPMVAWEVAIGRIRSACDLGLDQENFGISLWQYNLFKKYSQQGSTARLVNELKLERIRQIHFRQSVSRLRGVYFFDNERDAHVAVERWGIPENRKFITPVNFSATNVTHVDSEWITSYLSSDEDDWMKRYWSGETLGHAPLKEVLASGIGLIQSMELRQAAYQRILEKFPESTPLLAIACCGLKHAGIESIAQAIPGILRKTDHLSIDFYLYIGDLDTRQDDLMNAVNACKEHGELPPVVRPADPNAVFRLPDLTAGSFIFKTPDVVDIYDEVHQSIRDQ